MIRIFFSIILLCLALVAPVQGAIAPNNGDGEREGSTEQTSDTTDVSSLVVRMLEISAALMNRALIKTVSENPLSFSVEEMKEELQRGELLQKELLRIRKQLEEATRHRKSAPLPRMP